MIGLESTFGVIRQYLPQLSLEQLINMLTIHPRKIFGLPQPVLQEGAVANLTVFDPETSWQFTSAHIASRSKNSAYIGEQLKGKVHATVNGPVFHINN